jgi:hypothetical protein
VLVALHGNTQLGGWDWLLNLVPFVGPALYGGKKLYDEYGKEKPSAIEKANKACKDIYGTERLRCFLRATGHTEAQIAERLAIEAQYQAPVGLLEPWYVTYRNYLFAAGGLVAVTAIIGLSQHKR